MDAATARQVLTDELHRLDEQAAERRRADAGQVSEDERRAVDDADRAARAIEAMDSDLVDSTLRAQRERLVAAIERIDRGEYGRCAICGREIDAERLDARPETDRCREHADTRIESAAG